VGGLTCRSHPGAVCGSAEIAGAAFVGRGTDRLLLLAETVGEVQAARLGTFYRLLSECVCAVLSHKVGSSDVARRPLSFDVRVHLQMYIHVVYNMHAPTPPAAQ
jgi:hypothetical protein